MSVGTTAAVLIGAGVGAAGSIGSSLIGSSASKSAAKVQSDAANQATQLQRDEFNQTQTNEQPWLDAGKISLAQLMGGLQPGGQFATPYSGTFKAPTLEEAEQTPGYQFAQKAGEQAIEHGASAAGGVFNTGTLANLANFNQNLATTNYQQSYNNALNTFNTDFSMYNTNQANLFNRLASTSGLGQNTAAQLGQFGQEAAIGEANSITSGANANAGGIIGSANALASGVAGVTDQITGLLSKPTGNTGGYSNNPNPTLPSPVSYQTAPSPIEPVNYIPANL